MKIITVNLPEIFIKKLEEIGQESGRTRSELIRIAIRDFLKDKIPSFFYIHLNSPEIEILDKKIERFEKLIVKRRLLKIKKKRELEFYNYCILCDRKLHPETKPMKIRNNIIFKLRFCCDCFEKYEGLTLDDLPEAILKIIQKKLERYEKIIKDSLENNNENNTSGCR